MWSYARVDAIQGIVEGRQRSGRLLSEMRGSFADAAAYERALQARDPVLYYTTQIEENNGDGQLHYGLAMILPGKVGDEYFMTKGHIHAWRPAAEVYVGLRGQGMMLLEDERTGECVAVPLGENQVVYVPGYAAHRTINTGDEPLVYWGILPSDAGHDYGAVLKRNFGKVVVEIDGKPVVMGRPQYLARGETGTAHG